MSKSRKVAKPSGATKAKASGVAPAKPAVAAKPSRKYQYELEPVSLFDSRHEKNKLVNTSTMVTNNPGFSVKGDTVTIRPNFYSREMDLCVAVMNARALVKLLTVLPVHNACMADPSDASHPMVSQRLCSTDRKKLILDAWSEGSRVPDRKLEVIRAFAFNAKMSKSGISFGPDSLCCIIDGAGRLSAVLHEMKTAAKDGIPVEDFIISKREIVFQICIDVSGSRQKSLQEFLLYNRDAKKVSAGTSLAVEIAHHEIGDGATPDYSSVDWASWVIKKLTSDYDLAGSFWELFSWKVEGFRQTRPSVVCQRAQLSTLRNSLDPKAGTKHFREILKDNNVPIDDVPDMLHFIGRQWADLIHTPINEIKSGNFVRVRTGPDGKERKISARVVSSLGVRLILLVSARVYALTGNDPKEFKSFVTQVFQHHFNERKSYGYVKTKKKKMTPDDFWYFNTWFCESHFNSGAHNSSSVLGEFVETCDKAL